MKGEKKVVVTTPIAAEVLEELKYRTGKSTTKRALAEAVNHYLMCPFSKELDTDNIRINR